MTYIDQICLVSHLEIMDHRGLIQMSEFCHIVCLVELGRIYFIDGLGIDLPLLSFCQQSKQIQLNFQPSYAAVIALHKQTASRKLLDYPSSHER